MIICKICNPNNPLINGYCAEHSTSRITYLEIPMNKKEYNLQCPHVCMDSNKLHKIILKDGLKFGLCKECYDKILPRGDESLTDISFAKNDAGKNFY